MLLGRPGKVPACLAMQVKRVHPRVGLLGVLEEQRVRGCRWGGWLVQPKRMEAQPGPPEGMEAPLNPAGQEGSRLWIHPR